MMLTVKGLPSAHRHALAGGVGEGAVAGVAAERGGAWRFDMVGWKRLSCLVCRPPGPQLLRARASQGAWVCCDASPCQLINAPSRTAQLTIPCRRTGLGTRTSCCARGRGGNRGMSCPHGAGQQPQPPPPQAQPQPQLRPGPPQRARPHPCPCPAHQAAKFCPVLLQAVHWLLYVFW